jgi:hypothetical protein
MLPSFFKNWIYWILVVLFGASLCIVAVSMLSIRLSYERNFQKLDGKLVGIDEYPTDRGFWRSPRFKFRSRSGDMIEFKSDLGHVWLNYSVLDEVTVLHDSNSKKTVMAGFEELYMPVILLLLAGIVVLVVFALFPVLLHRYLYSRDRATTDVER